MSTEETKRAVKGSALTDNGCDSRSHGRSLGGRRVVGKIGTRQNLARVLGDGSHGPPFVCLLFAVVETERFVEVGPRSDHFVGGRPFVYGPWIGRI